MRASLRLTNFELDLTLGFLLYHMSNETRREMMATLPTAYAKIYPETTENVAELVRAALDKIKNEQTPGTY